MDMSCDTTRDSRVKVYTGSLRQAQSLVKLQLILLSLKTRDGIQKPSQSKLSKGTVIVVTYPHFEINLKGILKIELLVRSDCMCNYKWM